MAAFASRLQSGGVTMTYLCMPLCPDLSMDSHRRKPLAVIFSLNAGLDEGLAP